MRVAIVHDWLVVNGGAEKVLRQMLELYPQADVFCTVCFLEQKEPLLLPDTKVFTSFVQRLPFARSKYRSYLPLMTIAVEQFDLSGYDLVISSSHAVAKGVITGPNQTHVSYVHSPARYAWDLQHQYLRESGLDRGLKGLIARWLLHKFRIWDTRTSSGVDQWIANSAFIQRRIRKIYGKESLVIHPPVSVDKFQPVEDKENFYLVASRLVPYKRVPLVVDAFRMMPDKRLVVIGDGPEIDIVKSRAAANVTVLGYQSDATLRDYLQRAKAFIFAAEEDFGIMPLEAQACATPVIAFGKGGALETVQAGVTGLFFDEQSTESIVEAVKRFEKNGVSGKVQDFRRHVESFSNNEFRQRFGVVVADALRQGHRKQLLTSESLQSALTAHPENKY